MFSQQPILSLNYSWICFRAICVYGPVLFFAGALDSKWPTYITFRILKKRKIS